MKSRARRAAELTLSTIRLRQERRVLFAEVVNPPFNYMVGTMVTELRELVRAVAGDPSVGAVVVSGGVPGRYITHFDIGELSRVAEPVPLLPPRAARTLFRTVRAAAKLFGEHALARTPAAGVLAVTRFYDVVRGLLDSPATWLGMIDGPCGGGGLELSVCFDIRVAGSENAAFQLPELSIGLATTVGGQRLTQLVGPARAMEMLLEARSYTADEVLRNGLVNRVVPGHSLAEEIAAMAHRYAARPRSVVAAQKRIVNHAFEMSVRESLTAEGLAQVVGVPAAVTRVALRRWLVMQDGTGESVFLTKPEPWIQGTAVEMNPADAGPGADSPYRG